MLPKYRAKIEVKYILFTAYNSYNLTMSRYRYYNPNPIKSDASDCVVRALCRVTGMPWQEQFLDLAEKSLELGDMPSINTVWIAYLRDLGFEKAIIPNTCPDCYTIEDFCIDNPVGTYIVGTGSHVCTCVDGFAYDSWDSTRQVPIFYLRR